jgi:phosphoribosylformylglycinamidine synthase
MSKLLNARVHVMLKDGILDAQGKAILYALSAMGFDGIKKVRQGKVIDLELEANDAADARERVTDMCDKLLANVIIEKYIVEIT